MDRVRAGIASKVCACPSRLEGVGSIAFQFLHYFGAQFCDKKLENKFWKSCSIFSDDNNDLKVQYILLLQRRNEFLATSEFSCKYRLNFVLITFQKVLLSFQFSLLLCTTRNYRRTDLIPIIEWRECRHWSMQEFKHT